MVSMVRKSTRRRTGIAGGPYEPVAAPATGGDAEKLPNAPDLRSLARAHAAAAVDALAAVMRDSAATPAARVSAAGALLAWGYGKAVPVEDAPSEAKSSERIVRLVWGGEDG